MDKASKILGMNEEDASNVKKGIVKTKPKDPPPPVLDYKKHIGFLLYHLKELPDAYSSQECNRMTLLYFVLSSLDLLGAIDMVDKKSIIDWVYAMQVLPCAKDPRFRGSGFIGSNFHTTKEVKYESVPLDRTHIAMVYTALCILGILGDDYSRLHYEGILSGLRALQQEDGSFAPTFGGSESDMRFVYCAFAISYMLNDWSAVNVDKAVGYILRSQSYESSIGQGPLQEGHGGSSYCAIAALVLANRLDDLPRKKELVEWCVQRQTHGFNGRCNKDADTCYSFWVGGSLEMLSQGCASQVIDYPMSTSFTFCCESKKTGGFAKVPGNPPDVLHTYYSLCGLSILDPRYPLPKLHVPLSISQRAAQHIQSLYKK